MNIRIKHGLLLCKMEASIECVKVFLGAIKIKCVIYVRHVRKIPKIPAILDATNLQIADLGLSRSTPHDMMVFS